MKEFIVKEYETFPYKNAVNEMPELIRCKDCKYWLPDDEYADCDLHGMYAPIGDANDFCSCAERKE